MSESTSILPIDHTRLKAFEDEWKTHLADLKELPCSNEEEKAHWAQWLSFAQDALNELEEERKQLVDPINEDLKSVNGHYRSARSFAEDAKALVKDKLNAYAEATLKLENELRERAQLLAQSGDSGASQEALSALPDVQKAKGASTTFVWAWELVDYAKVPDGYKTINSGCLDQIAKVHKNKTACPEIPGIRFFQKASTSAR